jgi:hypothetical protein
MIDDLDIALYFTELPVSRKKKMALNRAPHLYLGGNNPTDWKKFVEVEPVASELRAIGVTERRADIYRWASRFRIAKSFEAVQLSNAANMAKETKALLDCLLRTFLTYTAFEQFCRKVLKIQMNEDADLKTLQDRYHQASVIASVRSLDDKYQLFSFLCENLDAQPASRMKKFINGDPCNVSFLGKAIRHVFAHGRLSPHSGSADLPRKRAITHEIHNFLIKVMDDEFGTKVIRRLPKRS